MDNKVLRYCGVAAILGIIAAATGFAAEATRVKASEVYIIYNTCVYPSSSALAFGIISAVFTIITRIYISVTFGGPGCCRTDANSTPVSKLLFVLSWVASVVAVILLLSAASLNERQGGQIDTYGYITCYVVKPGIFSAGAILALLSAIFGITAYITISQPPQTTTISSITLPVYTNVDPEKNPVPLPPQQNPPQQQYTTQPSAPQQQYPPQPSASQQYSLQQNPHQEYPPQQYPPQQQNPPQQYPSQ